MNILDLWAGQYVVTVKRWQDVNGNSRYRVSGISGCARSYFDHGYKDVNMVAISEHCNNVAPDMAIESIVPINGWNSNSYMVTLRNK